MTKYYIGQVVEITLDTEIADLSTAQNPAIFVIAPDERELLWPAVVVGSTLVYRTKAEDFYTAGDWRLQPLPNIPGAEAPGETAIITILRMGQ